MNEFEIEARADGSLRLECARTHEMTSKKKTRCNPIAAATTSTNERREWGEKRVQQQQSSQNFANRTRRSVSFVRTEPDAEAKAQHRAKFSKSNHDLRQLTKNCTIFFFSSPLHPDRIRSSLFSSSSSLSSSLSLLLRQKSCCWARRAGVSGECVHDRHSCTSFFSSSLLLHAKTTSFSRRDIWDDRNEYFCVKQNLYIKKPENFADRKSALHFEGDRISQESMDSGRKLITTQKYI